ncbi:MAG: hypothetical protein K0Q74_1441 [Gammaproteobacteria bacterium]|jgi:DNA-binding protein YbaB|nr:hypothetical protein [Gammaproteobacteria bacterium]
MGIDKKSPGIDNKVKEFLDTKSQDMAKEFQKMQDTLVNIEITGIGGIKDDDQIYVEVAFNGLQEVKRIVIGEGAMNSGPKVVADLAKAAFNTALDKLKTIMQKEIMTAYKNAGIPTGSGDSDVT